MAKYRRLAGLWFALTVALAFIPCAAGIAGENAATFDIRLGAVDFRVPEDWVDPGWRQALQTGGADTALLLLPPDSISRFAGRIDPAGIAAVSILLHCDNGNMNAHLAWMELAGAKRLGIAAPADAAEAFDGIRFDALYGGRFATSGKSASRALYLAGTVVDRGRPTIVTARIDADPDAEIPRRYVMFATMTVADTPFILQVTLDTSRPLRTDDLGWIDIAGDILMDRAPR